MRIQDVSEDTTGRWDDVHLVELVSTALSHWSFIVCLFSGSFFGFFASKSE